VEKVYHLPDLLPAPYSDLQALVRRLLEYADWSVLPALLDELKASGREREIRWLQGHIAQHLCRSDSVVKTYKVFVAHILGIYWFDLFDVTSTAAAMAKTPFWRQPPLTGRGGTIITYAAAEAIPAGSLVTLHSNGEVRRATPDYNVGTHTPIHADPASGPKEDK
jgi:hypothetical protein